MFDIRKYFPLPNQILLPEDPFGIQDLIRELKSKFNDIHPYAFDFCVYAILFGASAMLLSLLYIAIFQKYKDVGARNMSEYMVYLQIKHGLACAHCAGMKFTVDGIIVHDEDTKTE